MISLDKKLVELYNKTSKHSNYQLLHPRLAELMSDESVPAQSRYEAERLTYIARNVDMTGQIVADVGGNTGYFTFAALDHKAMRVCYFDGNQDHTRFVESAAQRLRWGDKLSVSTQYIDFALDTLDCPIDIIFLLNVLHHVGDDYGSGRFDGRLDALAHIAACLKKLAHQTHTLVFQLGFNWKGNKNLPLFEQGKKSEMIDFVKNVCKEIWDIRKIGVAQRVDGEIAYRDVSPINIERDDSLGEFLNRPIFILSSKLM